MRKSYYTKEETYRNFHKGSWENIIFQEFEATLTSKSRLFPCIFGVAGFQADQLRFGFSDQMNISDIAPMLADFVKNCRDFGQNTSLVVFSRHAPVQTIENYEAKFWKMLQDLSRVDKQPWPAEIPETLDTSRWEFCFAGEPIFVVCNTPAHIMRQSRRSSSFMVTFQPRWVFEEILGTTLKAKRSTSKVRSRLMQFDLLAPSPHLGSYGDPTNREYAQYFLHDENDQTKCPFHQMRTTHSDKTREKI